METIQKKIINTTISYLILRRVLGYLGIFLPLILLMVNDFKVQSSISHFYYTQSSVIFTSILFAFGLFLICYPGREKENETFSDNVLTNIGGVFAILTALIPTSFCQLEKCETHYGEINTILLDLESNYSISTQWIHNDNVTGTIHLVCAAIFLILMGWMSFNRFTKGKTSAKMKIFYKFCGVMVWLVLGVLGFMIYTHSEFTKFDVFLGEWIALFFFGISWLVKGKGLRRFGI